MAAMYMVTYKEREDKGLPRSVIVHAADAKNMTKAALRVATRNAIKRARQRLKRMGIKRPIITECKCVG